MTPFFIDLLSASGGNKGESVIFCAIKKPTVQGGSQGIYSDKYNTRVKERGPRALRQWVPSELGTGEGDVVDASWGRVASSWHLKQAKPSGAGKGAPSRGPSRRPAPRQSSLALNGEWECFSLGGTLWKVVFFPEPEGVPQGALCLGRLSGPLPTRVALGDLVLLLMRGSWDQIETVEVSQVTSLLTILCLLPGGRSGDDLQGPTVSLEGRCVDGIH